LHAGADVTVRESRKQQTPYELATVDMSDKVKTDADSMDQREIVEILKGVDGMRIINWSNHSEFVIL
jgi:hypothetical protein